MILNTEKKMSYNEGLEKGKLEGQNDSKLEIAKSLLQQNISIDVISKATGLSNEEILELK